MKAGQLRRQDEFEHLTRLALSNRTRKISQAVDDLERCKGIYAPRVDTLRLLAEVLKGSDYDGNVHSGISDPTPAHAAQLQQWHDLLGEIDAVVAEVCGGASRLWQLLNRIPNDIDTRELVRQHQCRGGKLSAVDPEGWEIEGLCDALADTRDGLCLRCYQRRYRWGKKPIEGAA